jgi:hypothetical protein
VENKLVGDGDAHNADQRFSSRDKLLVKSFNPIMGALHTNLKKKAIMYHNFAKKLHFWLI